MSVKQLRICLVTNDFPSLTETFITTKALELSKKGHQVTVIKSLENNVLNASHIAQVKKAGIHVVTTQLQSKKDLLRLLFKYPFLLFRCFSFSLKTFSRQVQQQLKSYLLNQYNFDIIHIEFSGLAISYQKALEETNAKTLVSCRGTAEKVKPLSDPLRKEQLLKLFSTIDAIHCVSGDMAGTIQPYCNHPEKIFINRPSVDADVFQRRIPYPAKKERIEILTIGRFTFQKGYLIGLMAVKKLLQQGILFNWTIVGDGPLKEEIIFHIHTLGLQNVVHLAGKKNRDEILELYNNTDIFMLTSVYEGIANVCLEAMSMELPLVATKSGGMEEVIENGLDGMLCEIYDADSLAHSVMQISDDAEKRKEMGINARKKILKEFTLQRQANVFEEKYLELITN